MKVTQDSLERRASALTLPGSDASIIDRIKYLITFMRKTQAEFGRLIDIDASNMSKMMSGRIPISDRTINRIVVNLGVSKRWLEHGDEVPFPRTTQSSATPESAAPVYDIDVTAGHTELSSMFTDERIIGHLSLPNVNPKYPIVRVSGDSMEPRIANGSFISIRPIPADAPIFWGQVYVVVTRDYRMVKVMRRHKDPDKVILHSYNHDYDDMDLNRDNILSLYLVETVMSYDIMG